MSVLGSGILPVAFSSSPAAFPTFGAGLVARYNPNNLSSLYTAADLQAGHLTSADDQDIKGMGDLSGNGYALTCFGGGSGLRRVDGAGPYGGTALYGAAVGTSNRGLTGAVGITQPFTLLLQFRTPSAPADAEATLADGASGNSLRVKHSNAGGGTYTFQAGSIVAAGAAATTWTTLRVFVDGANNLASYGQVGTGSKTNGNPGTKAPAGFTLGNYGGGAAEFDAPGVAYYGNVALVGGAVADDEYDDWLAWLATNPTA